MSNITRKVTLSLKYITNKKYNILNDILEEYKRLVNIYIEYYFNIDRLPKFPEKILINTKLSETFKQLAGYHALNILKTNRIKEDKKYKREAYGNRYKKVYAYFKKHNRQINFLNKKFRDLNISIKERKKPIFKGGNIPFNENFVILEEGNKSFDLYVHLRCLGNRIILNLPTKKTSQYYKFKNWKRKKSLTLRKINGIFYIDVFFEKEKEDARGKNVLGCDIGINKLISLSNGETLGKELKELILKRNRKVYASKAWWRTQKEIQHYICQEINKIDFEDIYVLVREDLRGITISTKKDKKVGKNTRKLLSGWNLGEFNNRLKNKCETSRTELAFVSPRYTSRTCPKCGFQDKKNRKGEYFNCIECGYSSDADINGAINILNRFSQAPRFPESGKKLPFSQNVVANSNKEVLEQQDVAVAIIDE